MILVIMLFQVSFCGECCVTKVTRKSNRVCHDALKIVLIQTGLNGMSENALNICSGLNFDKGDCSLT